MVLMDRVFKTTVRLFISQFKNKIKKRKNRLHQYKCIINNQILNILLDKIDCRTQWISKTATFNQTTLEAVSFWKNEKRRKFKIK